jgi:hypothetical protein
MACWLAYPPAAPADPAALEHIGPQGLRMERYRAPTPLTVPHAQTLGTGQLLSLMRDADPVLIDVQPVVVRPETREFEPAAVDRRRPGTRRGVLLCAGLLDVMERGAAGGGLRLS